jgi:hypothetical protein
VKLPEGIPYFSLFSQKQKLKYKSLAFSQYIHNHPEVLVGRIWRLPPLITSWLVIYPIVLLYSHVSALNPNSVIFNHHFKE